MCAIRRWEILADTWRRVLQWSVLERMAFAAFAAGRAPHAIMLPHLRARDPDAMHSLHGFIIQD